MAFASCAFAQGQSEAEHVPPDAPHSRVHSMPYHQMAEMMGMDDRARFGKVMIDELEWQDTDAGAALEWDAAAWYGGDYTKLRVESEGRRSGGVTRDSRAEFMIERIVGPWWSLRGGLRHDGGIGPERDWISIGVAGIAPGFVETAAAVYVGDAGRTALRLTAHYDALLTQRWILQPEAELDIYGRRDPARESGAGLSDLTLGLRLRYEARRELAPYFGLVWTNHFAGDADRELSLIAGLRTWF